MRNQDLEMYAHIAALEQELREMKALGVRDICPITPNRIEVMEVFISRMKNSVKNRNKTTVTALISTERRNKVADVYTDIAAMEKELKEMKDMGDLSPRTANRVNAMEGVIERMKNSVKDVDANGDTNRKNVQGFLNWLIESTSVMFGCFGVPREVGHQTTGEKTFASVNGLEMCFMEWLNHHEPDKSNDEWKSVLGRLKDGAIRKGIRLSYLLLDFLFLVSEGGSYVEIVGLFRDTLQSRIREDNKNLVVVKTVFEMLKMVEKEVRNLENKGEGSSQEGMGKDLVRQRKEFFDELTYYFCWQIESLDTFLTMLLLSKYVLVKTMEEGFYECETQLSRIEKDLNDRRVLLQVSDKEDLVAIEILKMQLKLKIRDLWSGFGSD